MTKELLSVREVADYLGWHIQTVYKHIRNKTIPFIRRGRTIFFKKRQIDVWINKGIEKQLNPINFLPSVDFFKKRIEDSQQGGTKMKKKRWNFGYGGILTRQTKTGATRYYIWFYDEKRKKIEKVIKNAVDINQAKLALDREVSEAYNRQYGHKQFKKEITFEEFAALYLENHAKPRKRSWTSDEKYLSAQLVPFFAELELSKITPFQVNKYVVKRKNGGVKNTTVNRELAVLKTMLNLAREWDYEVPETNPVKRCYFGSEKESQRNRVLSYKEEEKLISAAAPHLKQIIICALNTAMRKGEILKLKWNDVDFENHKIIIRAENAKDSERREIYINNTLLDMLLTMRQANNGRSKFVFIYKGPKTGKWREIKEVKVAFANACRKAGIEDLHFHDLRHTAGTRLINKGADLVSVSKILGHASLKTTQRYLHTDINQIADALNKLDQPEIARNIRGIEEIGGIQDTVLSAN